MSKISVEIPTQDKEFLEREGFNISRVVRRSLTDWLKPRKSALDPLNK